MIKLGVNIDHVATLRQARGTDYPDIVEAATCCEKAGCHGITVHLREDRRHIQDRDVYALRPVLKTRMNLEMANNAEIVNIALDLVPDEVCMVPEKREELTTEGGLDVSGQYDDIASSVKRLRNAGIVVSLFIDPDESQVIASSVVGASYVELHTGTYCNAGGGDDATRELDRLINAASLAHDRGLCVNAGHGLNLSNVANILNIPHLDTLNIGHSIIAESVFCGLEDAVGDMLKAIGNE